MAKILVEDPDGNTRVPFLRGILTRSLQNAGLPFQEAYKAATRLRKELGDSAVITSDELRERVLELLKQDYGGKVATRYQQQTEAPMMYTLKKWNTLGCMLDCSVMNTEVKTTKGYHQQNVSLTTLRVKEKHDLYLSKALATS